jgi:hypothetical protein
MLSKEILEAQETVELPAREMMRFSFNNITAIDATQVNASLQFGDNNSSDQANAILVAQQTGVGNTAG